MRLVFGVAGVASAILLSSAAQAGSPYVSVEAGVFQGRDNDIDEIVAYQSSQPAVPPSEADQEYDDAFRINYGPRGREVGILGGYDFGWLRLELELSHKNSALRDLDLDDNSTLFLNSINSALNRPSAPPDIGAPGLPALGIDDFDLDGRMKVTSAMVNAQVDIGITKRLSLSFGYGGGRTRVSGLGDSDGAWGFQRVANLRYAISPKVELGIKYRQFNSGIIKLQADEVVYAGNPDRVPIPQPGGGTSLGDVTTNARVIPELEGAFRGYSYLGTLTFNF